MARQVSVTRLPGRVGPWLDRWLADVAEPLGADRYRISVSQAELARREGISPGTVQERIRRLDSAGLIVSRSPLVLQVDGTTDRSDHSRGHGERNARCREAITATVRLIDVYGVTPALKAALAEMVAALEPVDRAVPAATDPRDEPRLWGLPAADPRPEKEDGGEISIQSPLLLAVPDPASTATSRPRPTAGPPDVGGGERADWDRAVAVLSGACRDRRLPDRPHSADALWRLAADITAAERTAAIDRVTAQVRAGDPVKDPFGLLYRVIEQRQPEYLESPDRRPLHESPPVGRVAPEMGRHPATSVEVEVTARRAADTAAREAAAQLDAESIVASVALSDDLLAAVVERLTATMPGPLGRSPLAISREVLRWCRAARVRHGDPLTEAVAAGLAETWPVTDAPPLDTSVGAPTETEPLHRRVATLLAGRTAEPVGDGLR